MAEHFARLATAELDCPPRRFAPEALTSLSRRSWPGNARELQNFVRRVVMFSSHEVISGVEMARMEGGESNTERVARPEIRGENVIMTYKPAKERLINEFTQIYVIDILKKTGAMSPRPQP